MHIVFSLPSTFPSLIVLLYGNWILGWEKVLQAIKKLELGKASWEQGYTCSKCI